MNAVQLEARMSKGFTPSSIRLRLMSGIPQIPTIVSQEQLISSMMPKIVVVACKLGTKATPSKRKSQSKNGQATYHIPMTT
jgi:hypothetical protein